MRSEAILLAGLSSETEARGQDPNCRGIADRGSWIFEMGDLILGEGQPLTP